MPGCTIASTLINAVVLCESAQPYRVMYDDCSFSKHPRFLFFALHMEMRWCVLQTGRVYMRQHPGDAQLSLDELHDMVGRQGEAFSSCAMHYAAHTLLSSILSTHTTWTSGVSLWLPKASAVTHGLEDEPILLTALNDGMVNSFNPVQLSAWWSNVDMQYIVSRCKVIEYCTKYVMKSEPRSQSLKEVFTSIVHGLKDGNTSLKAVHKLLINSVRERDYSAQETCHLLLQLPMFQGLTGLHCSQP